MQAIFYLRNALLARYIALSVCPTCPFVCPSVNITANAQTPLVPMSRPQRAGCKGVWTPTCHRGNPWVLHEIDGKFFNDLSPPEYAPLSVGIKLSIAANLLQNLQINISTYFSLRPPYWLSTHPNPHPLSPFHYNSRLPLPRNWFELLWISRRFVEQETCANKSEQQVEPVEFECQSLWACGSDCLRPHLGPSSSSPAVCCCKA